jgi:uncharacterized phage protein (TIGR02218 family)
VREIPTALAAHLSSGATTLCWCWKLTRRDGAVFGFTDHDRDLTFDMVTYEAASGLTATEVKESVGLSVNNLEVEGALRSDRLDPADLAAGLYDGASLDIYRVNWQAPAERVLIRRGSIGEVRRTAREFAVEVRGLAHALQQQKGRTYQYTCDAVLGDGRCGVVLSSASFRGAGLVAAVVTPNKYSATGLSSFATGWFSRGTLTFTSGANAGLSFEVKRHSSSLAWDDIELWTSPPGPVVVGDGFSIDAGCDKHFGTCQQKFANSANYRGFPHIPGSDFITSYPNSDDGNNDGGSRYQ